jgi:hypothetical protein
MSDKPDLLAMLDAGEFLASPSSANAWSHWSIDPPSGAGWRDQEPPQSHIKPASTRGTAYNHDRFGSGRPLTDQAAHAMATEKPRPIATYVHRPKRQPRKKAQATVITGPTI